MAHGRRRLGRGCDGAAKATSECLPPHPANKWVDGSGVSRQAVAYLVQMGRGCLRTAGSTEVLPNGQEGREERAGWRRTGERGAGEGRGGEQRRGRGGRWTGKGWREGKVAEAGRSISRSGRRKEPESGWWLQACRMQAGRLAGRQADRQHKRALAAVCDWSRVWGNAVIAAVIQCG
jgi:hypothetical protein